MTFDVYEKLLTYNGPTARDRNIASLHRDIFALAPDNPAFHPVFINDVSRQATVVSTQDLNTKTIVALPGEDLGVGDHVVFAKKNYYITSCSTNDGIYAYGKMEQCTDTIRFISKVDGEIKEYPVIIVNTTKFNTGETPNKRITLVSGQFAMYIPVDEHTLLIDNEDRFLIDKRLDYPSAYRVTYVDPSTYAYDTGLLNVILLQCPFNPDTDNKELMIADYYESADEPMTEITFDTDLIVKVGGAKKTFTPTITNNVSLPLKFDVGVPEECKPYVEYSTDDTSITFKVQNDSRLIGCYLTLSVADADDQYRTDVLIALKGLV